MDDNSISRRDFLYYGAATAAAGLSNPFAASAQAQVKEEPVLRVILQDAEGKPLPDAQVKTIIARDLAGDPLPQSIKNLVGESHVTLADEPIQLGCQLAVPGFGQVSCYADNNGKGYTKPGTIHFVVDAAKTRVNRVRQKLKSDGYAAKGDKKFEDFWAAAHGHAAPYRSLAAGLHAGERLVLLAAQRRIARLPQPRHDFLFGGLVAGKDHSPPAEFAERFKAAFNYGTLSWYGWQKEEPVSQRINYARMDESLQWCVDRNIVPKGYGYVYLAHGATPDWLRAWPYEKVLPEYKRVVEQTMRRYAGRIPVVEIINEAHDKTNVFRFNHEQILELTREACLSARQGAPGTKRMINNCCTWGEYTKNRNPDGSRKWTPYRYLADCVKSNVEFDCIGLQLYYPAQDLLEIERMLDRFKDFGRPLQISEMSCNSAPGLDPACIRSKDLVPGWHGPWTETMQADWLEAMYTLCYSKPEFEAVEWWDVVDCGGHFWPNGGLFHKDLTPKESYARLLTLKRNWGLTGMALKLGRKHSWATVYADGYRAVF